MKIYCIVCSRKKLETDRPVDALDLYLSPNIKDVFGRSLEDNVGFRILSGKFGLLKSGDKIGWYDYLLTTDAVEGLVKKIKDQMETQGIDDITFFAENRKEHPNWGPYYDVIENACRELGIPYKHEEID